SLNLEGNDRVQLAYKRFMGTDPSQSEETTIAPARRKFRLALEEAQGWLFARWPDLKDDKGSRFESSKSAAIDSIRRNREDAKYQDLIRATAALNTAEE